MKDQSNKKSKKNVRGCNTQLRLEKLMFSYNSVKKQNKTKKRLRPRVAGWKKTKNKKINKKLNRVDIKIMVEGGRLVNNLEWQTIEDALKDGLSVAVIPRGCTSKNFPIFPEYKVNSWKKIGANKINSGIYIPSKKYKLPPTR